MAWQGSTAILIVVYAQPAWHESCTTSAGESRRCHSFHLLLDAAYKLPLCLGFKIQRTTLTQVLRTLRKPLPPHLDQGILLQAPRAQCIVLAPDEAGPAPNHVKASSRQPCLRL